MAVECQRLPAIEMQHDIASAWGHRPLNGRKIPRGVVFKKDNIALVEVGDDSGAAALMENEGVVAAAAGHHARAAPGGDHIIAGAADELVVAGAAKEVVALGAGDHRIIAAA